MVPLIIKRAVSRGTGITSLGANELRIDRLGAVYVAEQAVEDMLITEVRDL